MSLFRSTTSTTATFLPPSILHQSDLKHSPTYDAAQWGVWAGHASNQELARPDLPTTYALILVLVLPILIVMDDLTLSSGTSLQYHRESHIDTI